MPDLGAEDQERAKEAIRRAVAYLKRVQQADGSWIPLWFGNQHAPLDQNPVFGTSRVLVALAGREDARAEFEAGLGWLRGAQNSDGGWGGARGVASTIEETALALTALVEDDEGVVAKGYAWLAEHTAQGTEFPASPIGFYFASLWYFEDLYPVIFAAGAFAKLTRSCRGSSGSPDRARA